MSDHPQPTLPLLEVLGQGRALVEGLLADPQKKELYAAIPEGLAIAGVGAHLRHCLDFVRGLTAGIAEGRVDYDARERDVAIENDPKVALGELNELARRVEALEGEDLAPDRPLEVRQDNSDWVRSTVGRELNIVMSHTVHHYALIAMTLRHFGVEPGREFGVAPATLSYWRDEGRCAPLVG